MASATASPNLPQPKVQSSIQSMSHLESFNSLVAERVFHGYKHRQKMVVPFHLSNINDRGAIGYEISSNPHYQLLLYFNVLLFPFWAIGQILVIRWKLVYFNPSLFHTLLMSIFYSFFIAVEPLRLWLGFYGNLKERVPDLAGAFLFTLFPQLFTCFYYMSIQPYLGSGFTMPFEIALNTAYCCLLIPQIVLGYISAQGIIKSQAASFFLTLGGEGGGGAGDGDAGEETVDVEGGRLSRAA
ncbi:hypothetical protein BJ741DRAFT_649719 [Chytriomyces cf. hyalinus JEL632]|nr:hypothetical protein BJ741DRAFT_649719 [Chytriomyces cf. hyalinus JEL632]